MKEQTSETLDVAKGNAKTFAIALAQHVQRVTATLLAGVLAEARNAGVSLRLNVLRANPAKKLHARLGFVVSAVTEHAFELQPLERGVDEIEYSSAKRLEKEPWTTHNMAKIKPLTHCLRIETA